MRRRKAGEMTKMDTFNRKRLISKNQKNYPRLSVQNSEITSGIRQKKYRKPIEQAGNNLGKQPNNIKTLKPPPQLLRLIL
jgi:hypothetical protein